MAKKQTFDVAKHSLVPKHSLLSEKEKEQLLKKLNIEIQNLPGITISDPAIVGLGAQLNDVIKIERNSFTSGKSLYYRRVING